MYYYEEVSLLSAEIDGDMLKFPCPCGDTFELLIADWLRGSDVAQCPTCSLQIKVLWTEDERAQFLSLRLPMEAGGSGSSSVCA